MYFICLPREPRTPTKPVDFLPVDAFLADEPACRVFWELVSTQFRTRSKFLAVWKSVSFVAVHRNAEGRADGFLLVSAPVNWQIDYVVVHPDSRGRGIAAALLQTALHIAFLRSVPYVMLTAEESLRPLYESIGFKPVELPQ